MHGINDVKITPCVCKCWILSSSALRPSYGLLLKNCDYNIRISMCTYKTEDTNMFIKTPENRQSSNDILTYCGREEQVLMRGKKINCFSAKHAQTNTWCNQSVRFFLRKSCRITSPTYCWNQEHVEHVELYLFLPNGEKKNCI